jgi:hypothetical protein
MDSSIRNSLTQMALKSALDNNPKLFGAALVKKVFGNVVDPIMREYEARELTEKGGASAVVSEAFLVSMLQDFAKFLEDKKMPVQTSAVSWWIDNNIENYNMKLDRKD